MQSVEPSKARQWNKLAEMTMMWVVNYECVCTSCSSLYINHFHMTKTCREREKKKSQIYINRTPPPVLHVLQGDITWHLRLPKSRTIIFGFSCTHTHKVYILQEPRLVHAKDSAQNKQSRKTFTIQGLPWNRSSSGHKKVVKTKS